MELHYTIVLHNQVWVDNLEKLTGNYITYILVKTRMIKKYSINQCML